jgi:DNA-binding response OmpR family regulator
MPSDTGVPRIWVIDRQDHLRTPIIQALHQEGFSVQPYKDYNELFRSSDPVQPDLVLLGCLRSQDEEKKLVEHLARQGRQVLILTSSTSLADMRSFFLSGALDVAERPHSRESLLSLVKAKLSSFFTHLSEPFVRTTP